MVGGDDERSAQQPSRPDQPSCSFETACFIAASKVTHCQCQCRRRLSHLPAARASIPNTHAYILYRSGRCPDRDSRDSMRSSVERTR